MDEILKKSLLFLKRDGIEKVPFHTYLDCFPFVVVVLLCCKHRRNLNNRNRYWVCNLLRDYVVLAV